MTGSAISWYQPSFLSKSTSYQSWRNNELISFADLEIIRLGIIHTVKCFKTVYTRQVNINSRKIIAQICLNLKIIFLCFFFLPFWNRFFEDITNNLWYLYYNLFNLKSTNFWYDELFDIFWNFNKLFIERNQT